MNRVVHHMMHMKLHMGWMSWYEDLLATRREKADEEHKKELEIAEAAGYKRARDEFMPDIEFLRNALQRGRAAAFAKYIDIFVGNAEKRGKSYCMGMWRSWTHDKAGRLEEERRLAELERLKAALKDAEADAALLKQERASLNATIKELEGEISTNDREFAARLKQMQHDLEESQTALEMLRTSSSTEIKHLQAMVVNKERQLDDQQQEMADKESRHARAVLRMEQKVDAYKVEADEALEGRKETLKKARDQAFNAEQAISLQREELQKAEAAERRARADQEVMMSTQRETVAAMHKEKTENAMLLSKNSALKAQIGQMEADMDALQKKHAKAESLLAQQGLK